MLVQELSGDELALWVARAERHVVGPFMKVCRDVLNSDGSLIGYIGGSHMPQYEPHEDWNQGGPLMHKLFVSTLGPPAVWDGGDAGWSASISRNCGGNGLAYFGETPLIAAMRCIVATKFGDSVPDDVPA